MKLGYKPPRKVRYKGIEYKVHDYWKNILETVILLEEEDDEYIRPLILVHKIFGVEAPIEQPLIDEALLILNNGQEIKGDKPLMDLQMDYQAYRMDIKQMFGIDIENENMSWSDFLEHIGYVGSKEGSSLHTKVRVRTTNPNEIDKKHRADFVKYQQSIMIKDKQEERFESFWEAQMRKAKEEYRKGE